jgi:hypothetical protein
VLLKSNGAGIGQAFPSKKAKIGKKEEVVVPKQVHNLKRKCPLGLKS